jgi:outer membrane protein assembly factor BamB
MNWLRATLAALVCSSPALAADWPQWLGPKRNGASTEAIEPWKDAPGVVWRAKVGPGFSSPVVAAGRVFVHARVPGQEQEEIIAFDATSGQEIWRTPYDRPAYNSVLNTGPQATPTVAGNRVYAFGITGMLTCCAADSGKKLWQVDAFKKLGANLPRFGVCCSPLVIGDRVIVAVNGKGHSVASFATDSGEIQWQALDEPASTSSPVLFASGATPGKMPDVVFMTTLRVIGLNPLDGSTNWEFSLPFQPSGTAPTPLVAGDFIVTSTMTNGTTGLRVKSGDKIAVERAWQAKDLSGYFSSGVAGERDRAYLVTNTLKPIPQADLCCVELATGKELWRQAGAGYFHFGMIRTGNGKLLLLDDAGNLKLIDATADSYRELCSAKVCSGNLVTPALSGGKLYARDDQGLVCIQLAP